MPRFDLAKYATVAERLQMVYSEYPDARVVTENLTTAADRSVSTWVVKASLYLTAGDQANGLAKATGHAFEVDGTAGANMTSALENAESSACGRAMALAGWSGDRTSLASRTEMEKVESGVTPKPTLRDYEAEASKLTDVDGLRWLYAQAKSENASSDVLERLAERARSLDSEGQNSGASASVPTSKAAKKA
ncbi:hypothetical protein N9262_02265 [Akkermansiaceae bacterium]|nr:hypothetical protein [Akkermansiaceae bacterium]